MLTSVFVGYIAVMNLSMTVRAIPMIYTILIHSLIVIYFEKRIDCHFAMYELEAMYQNMKTMDLISASKNKFELEYSNFKRICGITQEIQEQHLQTTERNRVFKLYFLTELKIHFEIV